MRIHQENTAKKLYRRVNTTTRHRSNNPGAEYRWERYKQKATDENMPQRASMHGKQKRGLDYSPLFMFLLTKVGQQWDEVYSHAVKRLDKPEPIFGWSHCTHMNSATMSVVAIPVLSWLIC